MGNEGIVIGLNHGCNCNCIMCPNSPGYRKQKDMTLQDVLNDLKGKITKNTGNLTITGGEPTLREDLFEILTSINQEWPDLQIRLLTNGRLFYYKSYLNSFLNQNFKNLEFGIPLCGPNSKIHDNITRVEGSFTQTIGGIKNLLKSNQLIELRIVIHKQNLNELINMAELIKTELSSILRVTFYYMQITGNALINKKDLYVSYDEIKEKISPALESLKNFRKGLCHFPLCTIEPNWWPIVWRTVMKYKLFFPEKCDECLYKKYCLGVHKSYKAKFGIEEFRPIKQKYKIVESSNPAMPIKKVIL